MAWLITLHDGGGSQVDAAQPQLAWTAANEQDAEQLQSDVQDWLNSQGYSDCWTQIHRLPTAHTAPSQAVTDTTAHYASTAGNSPMSSTMQQFLSMMGPGGQAIAQSAGQSFPLTPQAGQSFPLMPQTGACIACGQTNIPVDSNGLLATHDIAPNLRQVCPGSTSLPGSGGVQIPPAVQDPCICCGLEIDVATVDGDGDRWCVWCTNSNGCDKVSKTHVDPPTEKELAKAEAERKQAEFDGHMAQFQGVRLVINHPGNPGEKLVLDHTEGIPLLFVPGRRLKLQYNHDNPLDPANGEKYDVQVYIDGVRRKGKASIVIHEVKQTLPKAHRTDTSTTSDALEHAIQVARGHKEAMERRQRFETTEATEDIPDDIRAQLAALLGNKES